MGEPYTSTQPKAYTLMISSASHPDGVYICGFELTFRVECEPGWSLEDERGKEVGRMGPASSLGEGRSYEKNFVGAQR